MTTPAAALVMTPDQVDARPDALVRVNCYRCAVCLFAGNAAPAGGADAVWAAAGCPPLGATDEQVQECPNRPAEPSPAETSVASLSEPLSGG